MPEPSTAFYVFLLAVLIRGAAAAVRGPGRAIGTTVAGWLLVGPAGWAVAAAAGAWTPLWVGAAAGALATVAGVGISRRGVGSGTPTPRAVVAYVLADVGVVTACLVLATPALGPAALWPFGIAYFLVAVAMDLIAGGAGRAARVLIALAPVLLFGLAQLSTSRPATMARLFGDMLIDEASTGLALIPAPRGNRVELETGAVAWLERPRSSGPTFGAIVFHGADGAGSAQAATVALRLALLDAGYVVMSVDHPGFGRSPFIPAAAPLEEWDPLPTAIAAHERLTRVGRVRGVVAVGHSMGATDVLRLIAARPDIEAAFLFGAGGFPSPEEHEYYFHRFNVDRHLPDWLSRERTLAVRDRYYNNERAARMLQDDHPPVVFAVFEEDWGNLEATRDRVYQLIPGAKARYRVGSPHYFGTRVLEGVFFGNHGAVRQIADLFRDWRGLFERRS